MLAEKFSLVLETLRSQATDDRPEIVTSPARPAAIPQITVRSRRQKPGADEQD